MCSAPKLQKIQTISGAMKTWNEFLEQEKNKKYYTELQLSLVSERQNYQIFPKEEDVFAAFVLTPLEKVKVVILGQDPYHGLGQAHGLSFSVQPGVEQPPSLKNIFKELNSDLGIKPPPHNYGNLVSWAQQGVLLLNSTLTVRQGQPNSHAKIGWQKFTNNAIRLLNDQTNPIVFVLWGNFSREKKSLITNESHFIIESAHPSPFSCTKFFGSKPFSKTNNFLISKNISTIDWEIKNGT